MATPQENLERFKEIERRGLQGKLPPEKRARFDEAKRRGLLESGLKTSPQVERNQEPSIIDRAMAAGETGLSVVSGLGSSVAGGIAGGLDTVFNGPESGADTVRAFQESGTYQPRTPTGQEYLKNTVTAMNTPMAGYAGLVDLAAGNGLDSAVNTISRSQEVGAGKVAGDYVMDKTGSPVAATAAEVAPDALGMILGAKGLKPVAKGESVIPNINRATDSIDDAVVNATRSVGDAIENLPQSAKKQEIARRISEGSKDKDLAKFKEKELQPWERAEGKKSKIEKDPKAIAAIKQGFDEGVIQSVKQASRLDKNKMRMMVKSKRAGIKNQEVGAINRPSNIAGKSVGDMVREVERKRTYAGSELDKIAKGLRGQDVDIDGPVQNFVRDLAEDGIRLEPTPEGKMSISFKGSAIEGERPLELAITRIVNRMNDTDVPNAYDVHRLKQFIYNKVSYAKSKGGLAAGVEVKIKRLAESLDSTLDNQFPVYDRVNQQYSAARRAVDAIDGLADSKLDWDNPYKDNNLGTLLRRTMSNTASKDRLMDALKQVQEVANSKDFDLIDLANPGKFKGKTFNDNLIAQALFIDELDKMFKPAGRTSFQGQIGQALERGADASQSQAGLLREGLGAVGKGMDKLRGINEEGAFKAIEDLLKEP